MNNNYFKTFLYFFFIFSFIFFCRFSLIFEPFYNVDEIAGAVISNLITEGKVLYKDVFDHRGPMITYLYASIFWFFGKSNITAVHFALIIFIFITSLLIYHIAKTIWNKQAGYWSVFFFAVFSYAYDGEDFLAFHTEWGTILFECAGILLFLKSFQRHKYILLSLSGFFIGLAFFTRQQALLNYLVILFFCGVLTCYDNRNIKKSLLLSLSSLLISFMGVALFFIIYFALHDALKNFWFCFWEYNANYYVSVKSLGERTRLALTYFLKPGSFYNDYYVLLILFSCGCFHWITQLITSCLNKKVSKELTVNIFILCWAFSSYVGSSLSGRQFGHYYILTLPAFCLIAGYMGQTLLSPLKIGDIFSNFTKKRHNSINISKNFFLIFVIIGCLHPFYRHSSRLSHWKKVFTQEGRDSFMKRNQFYPFGEILKKSSHKDDTIFVWGWAPEIYLFSERTPASRYIFTNPLTGFIPWEYLGKIVPGSWDNFMKDLNENQPLYIIDTSPGGFRGYDQFPPEKFERFHQYLTRKYTLIQVFKSYNKFPYIKIYQKRICIFEILGTHTNAKEVPGISDTPPGIKLLEINL